jgi:hypothetical protein
MAAKLITITAVDSTLIRNPTLLSPVAVPTALSRLPAYIELAKITNKPYPLITVYCVFILTVVTSYVDNTYIRINEINLRRIWGSHSGDYEEIWSNAVSWKPSNASKEYVTSIFTALFGSFLNLDGRRAFSETSIFNPLHAIPL